MKGFGSTLGYLGLITFEATIIAELLNKTGATLVISESLLRLLGRSRSPVAVGTAGYLVAAPVMRNDTSFVILSPVARILGGGSGYSIAFISLVLAAGAYSSFKLVFPAAPLYAATIFHANLVEVILVGFVVSLPVFAIGFLWAHAYTRYSLGRARRVDSPAATAQAPISRDLHMPSVIESYGVIMTPLALNLVRAFIASYISVADSVGTVVGFVGNPMIAMLVGVGLALFLTRTRSREEVSKWISDGLARGASIAAIVGAGGVLGRVLIAADLGKVLGSTIAGIGISGAVTVFLVLIMTIGIIMPGI